MRSVLLVSLRCVGNKSVINDALPSNNNQDRSHYVMGWTFVIDQICSHWLVHTSCNIWHLCSSSQQLLVILHHQLSTFVQRSFLCFACRCGILCMIIKETEMTAKKLSDDAWRQWCWPGVVDSTLASITEVNQRRARLVLRWMTVSGFNFWCGTFISVCDMPPRSTQPGHPFVGRHNEYQPKGGDALRLGIGRYGLCVGGRWNCDPLVTHGPYLSASAVVLPIIRRYTNHQITYSFSTVCNTLMCTAH